MAFSPEFMTFALQGMPHRDLDEACRLMLRSFPEVPTVPNLSRSMRRVIEGMPCLSIDDERKVLSFDFSQGRDSELVEFYERYLSQDSDYFAIDPRYEPGLYKLAQMVEEKPLPELRLVHCGIVGPYTAGFIIKDENGAPAFYNDTMRDVIVKQLAMKATWYERKVKELFPGAQTLFHLGEPGLSVYTSAGGAGSWEVIRKACDEVLQAMEGITCIHCCSNMDWSLLMETVTDTINFDAYQYGNTMSLYPDALKGFLGRGGMIAWGIVPTTGLAGAERDIEHENPDSLVERLEGVLQMVLDKGIDKELLYESSWITPTCDVSTLPVELAERVYEFTREVSRVMRGKYFG